MTFVLSGVITFNVAEVWLCGCVFWSCFTDEEGGGV